MNYKPRKLVLGPNGTPYVTNALNRRLKDKQQKSVQFTYMLLNIQHNTRCNALLSLIKSKPSIIRYATTLLDQSQPFNRLNHLCTIPNCLHDVPFMTSWTWGNICYTKLGKTKCVKRLDKKSNTS